MKCNPWRLASTLIAALVCFDVPAALGQELDPKLVEAWKKAGYDAGWFVPRDKAFGAFTSERPKGAALPAFRCRGLVVPEETVKLPAPTIPFALDLSKTFASDKTIKELTRFKTLHTLSTDSVGVTDAGLATLSGYTNLQALSILKANITNAGLKRLAGLRSLKMLAVDDTLTLFASEGLALLYNTRRDMTLILVK